jgi:hypothetical protein
MQAPEKTTVTAAQSWLRMDAGTFDSAARASQPAMFDPRADAMGTPAMFDGAEVAEVAEPAARRINVTEVWEMLDALSDREVRQVAFLMTQTAPAGVRDAIDYVLTVKL